MKSLNKFLPFLAATILQQSLFAQTADKVIHVSLSHSPSLKQAQLHKLGAFDVLGVNHNTLTADIRASGKEIETLMAWGFQVSFASQAAEDLTSLSPSDAELYLNPESLEQKLKLLEQEHPDLLRVFSIGQSREGRDIWAAEITAPGTQQQRLGRPSTLFNAMHHARELMTTEVAFDIVETLVTQFQTNANVKEVLEKSRVFVVPQVNPDGNARVHGGEPYWRKNTWAEGKQIWGVDLNRNYPTLWNACNGSSGQKSSNSYRGPYAASEPETNGMMQLVASIKPVANISYHSYSELLIFPFGCAKEQNPSKGVFENLGNKIRQNIADDDGKNNTYRLGTAPEVIYEADGTDIDWQWQEHNVLSFAIEVNSSRLGFRPNYAQWRNITVERQRGGWLTLLKTLTAKTKLISSDLPGQQITAQLYQISDQKEEGALHWVPFDADKPHRTWRAFTKNSKGDSLFAFYTEGKRYRAVFTNELGQQQVKDF